MTEIEANLIVRTVQASIDAGRVKEGEGINPSRNGLQTVWTELDVWQYIEREQIPLPSLYYTHEREVVRRDGVILALGPFNELEPGEEAITIPVRFRTIGDMTCTGATESAAATLEDIVNEPGRSLRGLLGYAT